MSRSAFCSEMRRKYDVFSREGNQGPETGTVFCSSRIQSGRAQDDVGHHARVVAFTCRCASLSDVVGPIVSSWGVIAIQLKMQAADECRQRVQIRGEHHHSPFQWARDSRRSRAPMAAASRDAEVPQAWMMAA